MQADITSIMAMTSTTTMVAEGAALARLLCFSSPAFPTGGFAYSHGLEWAVEAGEVTGADSLSAWISTALRHGSGRSDAIMVRHAYRAADVPDVLPQIAELSCAAAPSRERQMEVMGQGSAFAAAGRAWGGKAIDAAYPVAFGAFARRQCVDEDAACIGYLTAWTGNLVSAGVRLVPLGQSDGLRVLAGLQATLLEIVAETVSALLDDIGTACFGADVASMLHETQYSRMFRS